MSLTHVPKLLWHWKGAAEPGQSLDGVVKVLSCSTDLPRAGCRRQRQPAVQGPPPLPPVRLPALGWRQRHKTAVPAGETEFPDRSSHICTNPTKGAVQLSAAPVHMCGVVIGTPQGEGLQRLSIGPGSLASGLSC